MKRFVWLLALVTLGVGVGMLAQTPKRLPVIAGNTDINVLVELDGTVKTWGRPGADYLSLGEGTDRSPEVKEPRLLAGVGDIVDAALGETHVLLLKRDGTRSRRRRQMPIGTPGRGHNPRQTSLTLPK